MKKISFIHAADLHLDSPMVGLKHLPENIFNRVKESTFTALKKLTSAAIERQVDFVIIAGDIYDGEDRSIRAQARFRKEMEKLNDEKIPVYIVHGNHDHLNGSWVNLDMPKNVHVFNSKVETKVLQTKSGATVHLYGFSYGTRHVYDRKIDEYCKLDGADYHIGILHGNESAGTEHDNYAPFTLKDLIQKNFDYWALGHIHKRAVLSLAPTIIYPGNIQGRNKKESGSKGFYYVDFKDSEAQLDFIEASDIIWEDVTVDAATAVSFDDLYHLCQSAINTVRKERIGTLLSLTLKNTQLEDVREQRSSNSELLELLLEDEREEESFVWTADLSLTEKLMINKDKLKTEANFYGELFETIKHYDQTDQALAPLYEHNLGRKYLPHLVEAEKDELLEKAEKLLIELLYQA
ncbi:metallophosphoesterase family protein [Neobacillus cucumis]|uniref:DNA repair exonuclease n=1 Tax=Neobacillus cucumis TaxID=1740721 RepID=A0A2N5HBX7_9BACI|nr:DNA repair exonuclease [Neobacillus cucumis]PLS03010.1 DNA repair exonuclease [Neobacillus cucumis]